MKKSYSVDPELVRGSGGVFKVWVDSDLIWDKRAIGRFPEEQEILDQIGKKAS